MVTDFVAQGRNFPNHALVPTFRNRPEIINTVHALLRLHARCPEGVPGEQVHVMSKDK